MANVAADVRSNIPFTDMTNPAKFPPYEHQEYPKMMLRQDGKPYRDTGDQPVLVDNEDEEREFRADNPDTLTITNDRALNSAERKELDELRQLRDGVNAKTVEDDKLAAPNRLAGLAPRPKEPFKAQPSKPGQTLKGRDGAPLPKPMSTKKD